MTSVRRRRFRAGGVIGTNAWTKSEHIEDAAWTKVANVNIATNYQVAPDGANTGAKVYCAANASSVEHDFSRAFPAGVTPSVNQVASVYVRPSDRSILWVRTTDKAGVVKTSWVDVSGGNGVAGTTAAGHTIAIQNLITNQWVRVSVTFNAGTGAGGGLVEFGYTTADNTTAYVSSGGDGLIYWGLQFNLNTSTASSYRSTDNTAFP